MMYAVTIEQLDAIFFLSDKPQGEDWQVQEGVGLDVPSNFDAWPEGEKQPEQVLCASISNALNYKLFKYNMDIDPTEFRPTGKHFGGVYSGPSWTRFVKNLPAVLAVVGVPDRERLGATDEAVAVIKQRH